MAEHVRLSPSLKHSAKIYLMKKESNTLRNKNSMIRTAIIT